MKSEFNVVKTPMFKEPKIKINRVPSTDRALVSFVAGWFDDIIVTRQTKPDLKGQYVIEVLLKDLLENLMKDEVTTNIKKIMREYGYKLSIFRSNVLVTKFR